MFLNEQRSFASLRMTFRARGLGFCWKAAYKKKVPDIPALVCVLRFEELFASML